MTQTISLGPVTRIEGHLDIEATVDLVNGTQQVVDAKCAGTMFRGFERILLSRPPLDAVHLTQRVCGVCPISHGMASSLALEKAIGYLGTDVPANGRIVRNLVLGANFVQSHILHFYHLAALDYIRTSGLLGKPPWSVQYTSPDLATGTTAARLVDHYVQALVMRRKAHQMGAIFGGKMPCSPVFVPGGATKTVTQADITAFQTILAEIRRFIDTVYVPDVLHVAKLFPQYYGIGSGCRNLLAYGVFELDAGGTNKLLNSGRFTSGASGSFDVANLQEDVGKSWYSSPSGLHPTAGETTPDKGKEGAYSWLKAPRYVVNSVPRVHEVGPLARMWVNQAYTRGTSVLDRHAARALEAQKIANAMPGWLSQLDTAKTSYLYKAYPGTPARSGAGLTEAPRGALGHWVTIDGSSTSKRVTRYQIVTPTAWNASPTDDLGQKGPIEQALIGTPVRDADNPIELLRVVHSFDPCLACAVHAVRPRTGAVSMYAGNARAGARPAPPGEASAPVT